ncbi:hypothetical protein B566_EDAN013855 [Ephemera danica]|nr:hypothetical protein B566_EDAN013855 [Ephemera danica]
MVQSCYSVVILLLVSQFGLQVDGKPSDGVPEFRLALERITASMEPENDSKLPDPACVLCAQVANQVLDWFSQGLSRDELVNRTTQLCYTTGIAAEHICYGTIDSYADMFIWMVDEKNRTGDPVVASDFCGFAMYPDCPLEGPEYVWTLDLDFMGPKPLYQVPQPPPEGSPTLQIVQFTDVHVDPNYVPGGDAECGEPTCCRFDQGAPDNSSGAAGYWGDYRDCDLPLHTYSNLVQQAAASYPETAYVIFTGDIPDHGVWATSLAGNTALFDFVFTEIQTNFPGIPILPIFGNHDPHPLNVYSSGDWTEVPQNVSQQWIYQLAADTWGAWLGPGITSTVMRAGYYSYLLRPDLLVIALNNNVCYTYNWWLIYDSVDIGGQLVWLAQTLLQAETAGQKVHLLMHLSGESGGCFEPWRTEFRRIVDRFENTITAQFYGHTHDDVMTLYYALDDTSQPSLAAFSGGSGTPYSDHNANFKAYTIAGDYVGSEHRVLDAESWYFNLTEANLAGSAVPPNWQKLYSFNEAYGTTSMLPDELDAIVYRMAANVSLQQQYFEFQVRKADSALASGCDTGCLQGNVCGIVSNTPGKCDELPWATLV